MIKEPRVGMKVIFVEENNRMFHHKYGKIIDNPSDYPGHHNGLNDYWWVEFTELICSRYTYRCGLENLQLVTPEFVEKLRREEHAIRFL